MFGSITRLQAVQGVVSKFVERRAGDRLGLVVFGGGAYLQSPLTTDHGLVKQLVEQLQVGMAGEGTAIGDGLGVALKRIRALPAKSASVILLTDGVSNVGQVNPIKAAKIAADLGIKVHSVGIGSERAVTIRSPGNILSNLVQRHVEFDEETLKEISRITGGVFFSASDIEGLERVYEEIDKLEQSDEEAQEQVVAEELFVPYALLGLLAFLLYQILALTVFLRVPW
jgi:Ca-activated chloride channel family protein